MTIAIEPPAAAAWRRRYRSVHELPSPFWNETLETLFSHRSVRRFAAEPITDEVIETLIGAAQSAPSSSNLQSWSAILVTDPVARRMLADWSGDQRHVVTAPVFIVFTADLSRAERVARRQETDPIHLDRIDTLLVGVTDAALAAQNAAVAAESLGLGTVYVGGIRNRVEAVADLLGLPTRVLPLFGLAIGRPAAAVATAVKPRLPQRLVFHRNRYAVDDDEAGAVAAYDRRLRAFQGEQGLEGADWSATVANRVGDPRALSGREWLRAALDRFGLGLR
jgi:nitroreductase